MRNLAAVNEDTDVETRGHNHDARYYTEAEVDSKLASKANTSNTVTTDTTQSVTGVKTFSSATIESGKMGANGAASTDARNFPAFFGLFSPADKNRWRSAEKYEYWDGTQWVLWSGPSATALTDGLPTTSVAVPDVDHLKWRVVFPAEAWSAVQVMTMTLPYNFPKTGSTVTVEWTKDDFATMVTTQGPTPIQGSYTSWYDTGYQGDANKVRITFDWTDGGNRTVTTGCSIEALGLWTARPNAQGSTGEVSNVPYSWDSSRKMRVWGLDPISSNLYDLGQAGTRWKTIYAYDLNLVNRIATNLLGSGTANSTTFLRGDGAWATIPGGVSTLEGLSDVTVTNPATGNVIRWSGTEWVNAALGIADISGLQTALDDKAALDHVHTQDDIQGLVPTGPAGASSGELGSRIGTARRTISSAEHSAFPGLCMTPDGRLMAVWRKGPSHAGGSDGRIHKAYSSDFGNTWTTPQEVLDDTLDLRDPSVSVHGDTIAMTYFKHDGTWAAGAFVRWSNDNGETWGPEYQINATGAICSPLVYSNGKYFAFYYDRVGTGYDSVWVTTSTDGTTWGNDVRLANGDTDGRDYNEPFGALLQDGKILVLFRYGLSSGIGRVISPDGGILWGFPEQVASVTGRPNFVETATGAIVMMPRSPNKVMRLMTSRDTGLTWSKAQQVEEAAGVYATYAAFVEIAANMIAVAYSVETTAGTSNTSVLKFGYISDGAGVSPLFDSFAGRPLKIPFTLASGMMNYGSPYGDAALWVHSDGTCRLSGLVRRSSDSTSTVTHVLGSIPEEYAPVNNVMVSTHAKIGSQDPAARVIVQSDGQVILYTMSAQIWVGTNQRWAALDGIMWVN